MFDYPFWTSLGRDYCVDTRRAHGVACGESVLCFKGHQHAPPHKTRHHQSPTIQHTCGRFTTSSIFNGMCDVLHVFVHAGSDSPRLVQSYPSIWSEKPRVSSKGASQHMTRCTKLYLTEVVCATSRAMKLAQCLFPS